MQAILLAGGLGTRLRSVVSDRPKPMALIENKPFMEYVVHQLVKHGICDIIFAVGYKGSIVEDYFKDGTGFGASISYSYEEEPLGTAGAIKNARKFIKEDTFFVLNADTFYQLDYSRLVAISQEMGFDITLVLREVSDVSRYGKAILEDNKLIAFNEKVVQAEAGTINGGVIHMKTDIIDLIPEGKVSLENEIIPMLLERGRPLGGIVNDGYFIDIGIPEAYYQFIEDVKKGVVKW